MCASNTAHFFNNTVRLLNGSYNLLQRPILEMINDYAVECIARCMTPQTLAFIIQNLNFHLYSPVLSLEAG
jgi:hypothetical protein